MADADSVVILSPRRGRPRGTTSTTPASTRLPTPEYDRLVRLALRHDLPVSAVIRELVCVTLRDIPY